MPFEELKEQIAILPNQVHEALERKVHVQMEASRLEDEIEKLEEQLKEEQEAESEEDEEENEDGDENIELINLEAELERLKVRLCEAEDRVELEFRRQTPKATDSYVKAAVGNDPEVNRLKLKIVDIKEESRIKKVTLQRERRAAWEARTQARSALRDRDEPNSEELVALKGQHLGALHEAMLAEVEVETLKAKLDSFKLLVQLESL
jgi:hypothetical protein